MTDVITAYNSEQNYATSPHLHVDFMFIIPEKGIMGIRDEEKKWSTACAPHQFLVVPPKQAHSTAALMDDQRHLVIYANADAVNRATTDVFSGSGTPDRLRSGIWTATDLLLSLGAAKHKMSCASPERKAQVGLIDQLLLLECLSIALTTPSNHRSSLEPHGAGLVKRLTEFLDNTVEDLPSLEQIASQFGVSKRHLTRTFSDITGQSILSYVQEVRVERAKGLLRHTRLSIIDIAERVGFQSGSHFAEIFRRLTQQSPKDWRRSKQSLS